MRVIWLNAYGLNFFKDFLLRYLYVYIQSTLRTICRVIRLKKKMSPIKLGAEIAVRALA